MFPLNLKPWFRSCWARALIRSDVTFMSNSPASLEFQKEQKTSDK
jgi:hypothetical protein